MRLHVSFESLCVSLSAEGAEPIHSPQEKERATASNRRYRGSRTSNPHAGGAQVTHHSFFWHLQCVCGRKQTRGDGESGEQERRSIRGSAVQSPPLVDVSLSKTLDPELLPVAVSTVCECTSAKLHVMFCKHRETVNTARYLRGGFSVFQLIVLVSKCSDSHTVKLRPHYELARQRQRNPFFCQCAM